MNVISIYMHLRTKCHNKIQRKHNRFLFVSCGKIHRNTTNTKKYRVSVYFATTNCVYFVVLVVLVVAKYTEKDKTIPPMVVVLSKQNPRKHNCFLFVSYRKTHRKGQNNTANGWGSLPDFSLRRFHYDLFFF